MGDVATYLQQHMQMPTVVSASPQNLLPCVAPHGAAATSDGGAVADHGHEENEIGGVEQCNFHDSGCGGGAYEESAIVSVTESYRSSNCRSG